MLRTLPYFSIPHQLGSKKGCFCSLSPGELQEKSSFGICLEPILLFILSPARCTYKPLPHPPSEESEIPHENSCLENLFSPQLCAKVLKQEPSLHQWIIASSSVWSYTDWLKKQHGAWKAPKKSSQINHTHHPALSLGAEKPATSGCISALVKASYCPALSMVQTWPQWRGAWGRSVRILKSTLGECELHGTSL